MPGTSTPNRKDKLILTDTEGHTDFTIDFNAIHHAFLTLRIVKNPIRKKILFFLNTHTNAPVSAIYKNLKMRQAHVSHELSVLRKAGIVDSQRVGKSILYSINKTKLCTISALSKQLSS